MAMKVFVPRDPESWEGGVLYIVWWGEGNPMLHVGKDSIRCYPHAGVPDERAWKVIWP